VYIENYKLLQLLVLLLRLSVPI